MSYLLDHPYQLFVVMAALLPIAAEVGLQLSSILAGAPEDRSGFSTIYGGILGLLGLILGFTFAMALGNYEVRQQLVIDEANAIGTTWLRAEMIPAPYRDVIEKQLREYVSARLDFYSAGIDQHRLQAALLRSANLQRSLWSQATGLAHDQPTPITALFVQSLNEMIDIEAKRLGALEKRIPGSVWVVLVAVSATGSVMTGTLFPRRTSTVFLLVPIVLALVMTLIADLDTSRRGLIQVSQESLVRVSKTMNESFSPAPSP